jgi:hypothetical protein
VYDPGLVGAELDGGGGVDAGGSSTQSAGAGNANAGKSNAGSGGASNMNGQAGATIGGSANVAGASSAGAPSGGAGNVAGAHTGGAPGGGAASGGAPSGGAPGAGAPSAGAPAGGSAAAGAPAAGAPGLNPCDKANWKATASSSSLSMDPPQLYNPPLHAIDGIATTRWSSGVDQTGVEWFLLNLGAKASHLTKLVLDTTKSPTDFPVAYKLELSSDGTNYSQVASGAGAAVTTITFADTPGQYVRVSQTGVSASWWSIQELTLTCTK